MRIALALGVLVATLAAAPSAGALDRSLTIRVVSSVVSLRQVDQAPKGRANPGDAIVSVNRLHNEVKQFGRRKGAVVGTDRARVALQRDGSLRISGSATLPGGTIRFSGRVTGNTATVVIRVVGGTGRYANAVGTVAVTDLDERGTARNVYKLVPGGANVA